jgi:hypothetical protein
MILTLLLLVPFSAGLLCLATRSRVWWERLNLLTFAVVAGLAALLAMEENTGRLLRWMDSFVPML